MEDQRVIGAKIFGLIWPAAAENLLVLGAQMVNLGMVGRLGAEALGAVGLGNRLTNIVWALFTTFTIGAVVRVAQAVGARQERLAVRIAEETLVAAAVCVAGLATVLWLKAPFFLHLFGAESRVVTGGAPYLRLLALGMPAFAVQLVAGSILRGAGNSRTPMLVALFANLLNLSGNYVLIFGRLGLPALGLNGSALATVVSQYAGAAIALGCLLAAQSPVRIGQGARDGSGWRQVGPVVRVGFPNAMESLAWQIAAAILTGVITAHGTAALAGYQVGLTVEGISYMPVQAVMLAATTLVGQAAGGHDLELARRYIRGVLRWGFGFILATAAVLYFFPYRMVGLLTQDPEVVAVGATYLRYMAFCQLPYGLAGILNGALRGAGHTREPLVAMSVGLWAFRLPLALYFSRSGALGLPGIWLAILIDLVVRFLISLGFFHRSGWRKDISPAEAASA